jgi:hypothetical protein
MMAIGPALTLTTDRAPAGQLMRLVSAEALKTDNTLGEPPSCDSLAGVGVLEGDDARAVLSRPRRGTGWRPARRIRVGTEQLGVGADRADAAGVDDHEAVGHGHRGQSVGDDSRGVGYGRCRGLRARGRRCLPAFVRQLP